MCRFLGGAIVKKYIDKICDVADHVKLSNKLHGRDLISGDTKNKAGQAIGISKYQMNTEIMNEAEKVIKIDKTGSKFIALCEVLQEMELLKEYGDKMMEEAGLSG